jgi:hypothetical protein
MPFSGGEARINCRQRSLNWQVSEANNDVFPIRKFATCVFGAIRQLFDCV